MNLVIGAIKRQYDSDSSLYSYTLCTAVFFPPATFCTYHSQQTKHHSPPFQGAKSAANSVPSPTISSPKSQLLTFCKTLYESGTTSFRFVNSSLVIESRLLQSAQFSYSPTLAGVMSEARVSSGASHSTTLLEETKRELQFALPSYPSSTKTAQSIQVKSLEEPCRVAVLFRRHLILRKG